MSTFAKHYLGVREVRLKGDGLHYRFNGYSLDTNLRELRRGPNLVTVEPQVFDLLEYLLRHREHVVSKDDLLAGVWRGRNDQNGL